MSIFSGQRHRLNLVKKFVDLQGKDVLDLGCGIGVFTHLFYTEGARAIGLDTEDLYLKKARELYPYLEFVKGRGEDLPFPSDTFHLVFSNEVLEHTDDDLMVLKESFRVLKPGGYLVIFVPNKFFPFETHGFYLGSRYFFGNIPFLSWAPSFVRSRLCPHVRIYTPNLIRELLNKAGFDIVELSFVWPGFDKKSLRFPFLRRVFVFLKRIGENTFLRYLGISIFVVARKPE